MSQLVGIYKENVKVKTNLAHPNVNCESELASFFHLKKCKTHEQARYDAELWKWLRALL